MRKPSTFIISYEFAQEIVEDNLQKEFAVWLILKGLFKRNCIVYNSSYKKLSQITNISYPTLQKYIPRLIELDWVRVKDGHLFIRAFRYVCGSRTKNSGHITVHSSMRFNEVVDSVRSLLIVRDFKTQDFRMRLTSGRLKAKARHQRKLLREYGERVRDDDNRILTSCRRIAKQSNLETTGAWLLSKRLTKRKIVRLKPVFVDCGIPGEGVTAHHEEGIGFFFHKNGNLFLNRGTEIRIPN